jgi:hypothetical protein
MQRAYRGCLIPLFDATSFLRAVCLCHRIVSPALFNADSAGGLSRPAIPKVPFHPGYITTNQEGAE